MTKTLLLGLFTLMFLLASAHHIVAEDKRIGRIAFFGQEGVDTAAVRNALPFREGSIVSLGQTETEAAALVDPWKQAAKDAVKRAIGREPTDVARVCCDAAGAVLVYIGLPGSSSHTIRYNEAPKANIQLPDILLKLDAQIDELFFKAIVEGRAAEDDSEGYALSKDDPVLRNKQLEFRDLARVNEPAIFRVAESASNAEQRAIAATALGYVRQNDRQIAALVKVSFDHDEDVRNNAVRAIAVLLFAKPEVARHVPTKRFINLLSSKTWLDRNKALMVLSALTKSRDQSLLRELKSHELIPLTEAAHWDIGHAGNARMILGRIAGIDEQRLLVLAQEESRTTILNVLQKR